ncbi:MAG: ATP-binding cassette domain-containing protein, partial [Clostridia bacterium]
MSNSVLKTNDVIMRFGGVVAVNNFNIDIKKGSLTALIGPNGAGKTTAFNIITGVYTPTEGTVFLDNDDITGKKPDKITKMGIARTFQNIRLFKNLTVLENVQIAKHVHINYNFLSAALRLPKAQKGEKAILSESLALLERMDLLDVKDDLASALP